MSDEVRVGLVGYGTAGRVFHAPVIQSVPGLRLAKVVERRSRESSARYPGVEVVADAAALFASPEIELVVVATPNDSHAELARAALEAGKHVVVDKPFALASAEADRLVETARERGRIVTAFQNRRWDGDFLTVRRVVDGALLGRLVDYESHFDRYRPAPRPGAWREGGGEGSGVLFDLGPHLVDQALVLFGPPLAVTADLRTQREAALAVDNFEIALHYDRMKATLKAGMLARAPGPRFALHGTRGSFVKYGYDPQEEALKAGRTPAEAGWGEEPRDAWGALDADVGGVHVAGKIETLPGAYPLFYRNVLDAIRGRAALDVKPEEARATTRVIELAVRSAAERRTLPYAP
jgi:predicted dehydrogenase